MGNKLIKVWFVMENAGHENEVNFNRMIVLFLNVRCHVQCHSQSVNDPVNDYTLMT